MQDDTKAALNAAFGALATALRLVGDANALWQRDAQAGRVDGGAFPVPDKFPVTPAAGRAALDEMTKFGIGVR